MSAEPLLRLEAVARRYPAPVGGAAFALVEASLEVRPGSWTVLTGRSGADGAWQVRLAPEDGEQVSVGAAITTKDGKHLAGSLEEVRADAQLVRLVLRPVRKQRAAFGLQDDDRKSPPKRGGQHDVSSGRLGG